jgi:Rrf2 family protein
MKITKAVEFGLLAVGHIAKYGVDGYVPVISIAKKYGIEPSQIAKSVKELFRAGILKNRMGPKGGFKLARPANKITMLEIIEVIDGPLDRIVVTSPKTNDEPFMINMETTCKDIIAKAKDKLQKTTIAKMIKKG